MPLDLLVFVLNLFSSVQSFSHVHLFTMSWTAVCKVSLCITKTWSLLKLMSIELVMPTNHLILCLPLLLPSVFPYIRVFSIESVLPNRWANYWSFNFSISPSSECSGLISFRMDWFALLAVQGTLKSLLQHHSSKGIYVCHLSVMSYSPCWDLTTKTEFKQYEKMRINSQCLIYTHEATRRGSSCIQWAGMDRSHAKISPGSPRWATKHHCLYCGCHSSFVFFDWEDVSKLFFCMFVFRDKIFHGIDYGDIISEIYPCILSS